ncbi:uncharacterized protein [Paramisgurnus dabryanus]|uniref:uncharacterized protein isoform X1 n=1 Tax=Paramisgurnus dabryanus TaxID=90735 RepID=UPI0031F3FC15
MKTTSLLFFISLFINGVFGDEVKSVSVMEGDSVTLHTDINEIQTDDLIIVWTFGTQKTGIAKINREANTVSITDDVLDGRSRGRLHVNNQTGDLTITNITTNHTGLYEVQITVGSKIIQKSFNVNGVVGAGGVKSMSVMVGDSVTLHTDDPDIKKYDVIQWRFQHENSPLAELNRNTALFSTFDDVHDGIFKDKLQLDVKTGSLGIRNIRTKHSGLYEVDIISSSTYTIHQSFTVTVSDKIKSVSVIVGYPVTLQTHPTDIQRDDHILWMFLPDDSLIAQIYKLNNLFSTYDGEEGRFRGRVKLNDQTGDLTISDSKTEHTGLYEVKMNIRRRSIQRRFNVYVSERGLSSGAIAGISVISLLAAAAVVALIYYRHKIAELGKTKTLEVNEEESVDLKTEVTDIEKDDLIEWRFKETLIAEISPANNPIIYHGDTGLFRDKLELNRHTGDLTINDIRQKHTGVYKLKIIRGGKTSYKRFNVILRDETKTLEVNEEESVDLKTKVTDIQRVDLIEWRFGETLIAEIKPFKQGCSIYRADKMELNHQTGDLTINDFRQKNTGVYTLRITRGGETLDKRFSVFVRGETLKVDEGKSVDLKTEVTDIQGVEKIEWRFKENFDIECTQIFRSELPLIAEIHPANKIFYTYNGCNGLFRGKLKPNPQTGDLIIKDIREEHTGVYKLRIIRDGKTSERSFIVSVRITKNELRVDEGKSVDLKTEVKDIKRGDLIEWRSGETLIAEINPANKIFSTYDGDDDEFRDKLELNPQTGDLNIKDIRQKLPGVYRLKITRDGETSNRRFIVYVEGETKELKVDEGESVDLKTEVTDLKRDDLIEWRFGDKETLIAQINPPLNIFRTYKGDDDLFRDKLTLNRQTGDLTIKAIRKKHEGDYTMRIIKGRQSSYRRFRVSVTGTTETLEVDEGKSADLKTEVKDIQRVDLIEWIFGETLIAEINPANNIFSTYDGYNGLFRDKLKLNHQTGDLNINHIRWEHDGVYKLKIIRDGKTSNRSFGVTVRASKREDPVEKRGGDSVGIEMQPLLPNSS